VRLDLPRRGFISGLVASVAGLFGLGPRKTKAEIQPDPRAILNNLPMIERSQSYSKTMELGIRSEFNAQVWAREFVKVAAAYPSVPHDEDAMVGWFANAIMTGYDFARNQTAPVPRSE
jgi:hypothetical protein